MHVWAPFCLDPLGSCHFRYRMMAIMASHPEQSLEPFIQMLTECSCFFGIVKQMHGLALWSIALFFYSLPRLGVFMWAIRSSDCNLFGLCRFSLPFGAGRARLLISAVA